MSNHTRNGLGRWENYTRNECRKWKNTLETSVKEFKPHSKRVWKMEKYTRTECKKSHAAGVSLVSPVSFLKAKPKTAIFLLVTVLNMFSTIVFTNISLPGRTTTTLVVGTFPLVSSVFFNLPHSFRVYFYIFLTRFECIFQSSSPVPSVFFNLPHSFRVYFSILLTRFECIFYGAHS
jgi:hypothetical protein